MSGTPAGMPGRERAMEERVLREARARGIGDPGGGVLGRALELAMGLRRAGLPDEHDPALLHPGRTVLILLGDTPERDPVLLAAAALVESDLGDLRVEAEIVQDIVGQEVADLLVRVPMPLVDRGGPAGGWEGAAGHPPGGLRDEDAGMEDIGLLEALLDVPIPLARVALAERLDHLRHLHLEGNPARRRRMFREAVEIYAPLAPRVDPVLARRYDGWCRMFARRHLPSDRA